MQLQCFFVYLLIEVLTTCTMAWRMRKEEGTKAEGECVTEPL